MSTTTPPVADNHESLNESTTGTTNESEPLPPSMPTRLTEEPYSNPQIAALHAMFPDFDPILLQSVLDGVGGNQDRAIDKLLMMSDPEYEERRVPDQVDLDEQLAHRLMLEDQEQHIQWQQSAQQGQYREPAPPRDGRASTRSDFQEVSETFNKIAESGKKTFSSLLSKAKAKLQEFDQSRNDPNAQYPGAYYPANGSSQPDRHTMMQQQSYYDPNVTSQPAETDAGVHGYDMSSTRQYSSPPASDIKPAEHSSSVENLSASVSSPQLDPSKLGLLPKRPISLVGSNTPPRSRAPDTGESDALEYEENPFEEKHR